MYVAYNVILPLRGALIRRRAVDNLDLNKAIKQRGTLRVKLVYSSHRSLPLSTVYVDKVAAETYVLENGYVLQLAVGVHMSKYSCISQCMFLLVYVLLKCCSGSN